jgi:phosphoesterase RecJ-like protein
VETASRVLLTGPVGPDGDSIGACLALARGIAHICATPVDVAGAISYRYSQLPGADEVLSDETVRPVYDVVVILDGDRHRLEPEVEKAWKSAQVRIIIDHHASTTTEGYDLAILDGRSPSTCQMIYALLQSWEVPLDSDLAALIYTGIIFDTGGFRHANTDPGVHRLAAELLETGFDHSSLCLRILSEKTPAANALTVRVLGRAHLEHGGRVHCSEISLRDLEELGARASDIEGLVEILLNTVGVQLSVLLIERDSQVVKLSFRSRHGSGLDVAELATTLSPRGGGHARAAGAVLQVSLEEAAQRVHGALKDCL